MTDAKTSGLIWEDPQPPTYYSVLLGNGESSSGRIYHETEIRRHLSAVNAKSSRRFPVFVYCGQRDLKGVLSFNEMLMHSLPEYELMSGEDLAWEVLKLPWCPPRASTYWQANKEWYACVTSKHCFRGISTSWNILESVSSKMCAAQSPKEFPVRMRLPCLRDAIAWVLLNGDRTVVENLLGYWSSTRPDRPLSYEGVRPDEVKLVDVRGASGSSSTAPNPVTPGSTATAQTSANSAKVKGKIKDNRHAGNVPSSSHISAASRDVDAAASVSASPVKKKVRIADATPQTPTKPSKSAHSSATPSFGGPSSSSRSRSVEPAQQSPTRAASPRRAVARVVREVDGSAQPVYEDEVNLLTQLADVGGVNIGPQTNAYMNGEGYSFAAQRVIHSIWTHQGDTPDDFISCLTGKGMATATAKHIYALLMSDLDAMSDHSI